MPVSRRTRLEQGLRQVLGVISLMYGAQAVLEVISPGMAWDTAAERIGWVVALVAFAAVAVAGFSNRGWVLAAALLIGGAVAFPVLMSEHALHGSGYLNTPAALAILIFTCAAVLFRLPGQLLGIAVASGVRAFSNWATGTTERTLEMLVGNIGQAGFLILLVTGLRAGADRADQVQSRGWIATHEAAHQTGRAGAADAANRLIHDSVLATLTVIAEARTPAQQRFARQAAGQTVADVESSRRSVDG